MGNASSSSPQLGEEEDFDPFSIGRSFDEEISKSFCVYGKYVDIADENGDAATATPRVSEIVARKKGGVWLCSRRRNLNRH